MSQNWYSGNNHVVLEHHRAAASLITFVDDAVKAVLPPDSAVVSITPHGQSFWGRTAKIDVVDKAGSVASYFIKVHPGPDKQDLVASEHRAMEIMHSVKPDLVPRPIAHGSSTWFYVAEFRDLMNELPDLEEFSEAIADLHARGADPTAKFGWPFRVFCGRNSREYPLSDSWEETFTQGLLGTFSIEEQSQGSDDDWTRLRVAFIEKVIPRLLRPLQTGGRSIIPTVVHGDIWHGNAGVDANTGRSVIFDPTALYAHHEFELGPWHCPRHRIGVQYIEEYVKHCPPSEPQEDFYDRMMLYAINFDVQSSSNFPGNLSRREIARAQMKQLLDKYPEGYEGWLKAQSPVLSPNDPAPVVPDNTP